VEGSGPETAAKFAELDVTTPAARLAYIPRAYRDWRTPTPIGSLREADGETIVVGRVVHVKERKGRLALITVVLDDGTGETHRCATEEAAAPSSCSSTAARWCIAARSSGSRSSRTAVRAVG